MEFKHILKNAIYIVATPIGNLGDITKRAIEVLQNVDQIAAEDTRHSKQLLVHLGVSTPLVALHEHNEREQTASILAAVQQGSAIALISDAGTPLISDPGYYLVREAHMQGIKVVPIPGPSALICALSASGLATDHFCFEGFLPAKSQARIKALQLLLTESRTMVFYETPHRILDSVEAMCEVFGGQRSITMARELTKQFETIYSSTLENLLEFIRSDSNQQRGEFVLMLAGAPATQKTTELTLEVQNVMQILAVELGVKQAAGLAAKITGCDKKELYKFGVSLNNATD